jgi:16S rRNA (cytosine1402-N4)-methyltransferase
VLYRYGEERQSRRVARAIVGARPIETTGQLANVIRRALGHKPHMPKDPATRSFQAIRIHVNDELGELEACWPPPNPAGAGRAAGRGQLPQPGDRIVKQFLKAASGEAPATSRYVPVAADAAPVFTAQGHPRRRGRTGPQSARAFRHAAPRHPHHHLPRDLGGPHEPDP